MDEMLKDARFAHIVKDPKFRRIPKAERKIKIDRRFKGMFKDEKFTVKYTVDKRGRPVDRTTTEDLRKYYDLSSSEDENDTASASFSSTKDSEKTVKKSKEKPAKNITLKIDSAKDSSNEKNKNKKSKDDLLSRRKDLSGTKAGKCLDDHEFFDNENESENESLDTEAESENESLDIEAESSQKELSQEELDRNDKQLSKRRKDEKNELTNKIKDKLKDLTVNYARGEGILLTDSSSEEELSDVSDDEEIEHNWGELDKEAETTDEITRRLAICNMDWDRIRAVDLMILLNSFLPSGGLVHSVTIYPSEFGLQRMKEEEINGPKELRNETLEREDEIEDDNEEGEKYHMEKLRQYQLNRLKYFYAVAEFDSAETANKVYTECDNVEYESTATKLDLRFIPDDMTFDQEFKDKCTEIPEPVKYQPREFTTTALQQVKVQLTWDETNPDRQEFTQKLNSGKLQDIDENDLQTYLASGSESDSEEKVDVSVKTHDDLESETNFDVIGKYKSLLRNIEEEEEAKKNKDVELEFTWGLGAKEKAEKLVKERMNKKEELTPFEQYLEKRKAKRKAKKEEKKKLKEERPESDSTDSLLSDVDTNNKHFANELEDSKSSLRKKSKENDNTSVVDSSNEGKKDQVKAELELLLMDQNEDGKKHFNMKQIEENATMSKSKRKRLDKKKNVEEKAAEDDFEVNVKDPRFAALFTSHYFNIDPADPHYRKTKGTEALVNEKLKRRANNEACKVENDKLSKKSKTDEKLPTELQALVKSVKRKTQNMSQSIK
ncbi:hypothetical protein PUN28_001014 [Cardiocondyla obscurior]|uniref:ESF1-like protein n=1 Tax=Cardiocondyla obscurior TaxID=286306 RepID=A0AAW2H2F7_9HYME